MVILMGHFENILTGGSVPSSLLGNLKKSSVYKVGLQTRVQGNNPYHKIVYVKIIMKLPVVAFYRCRGLV